MIPRRVLLAAPFLAATGARAQCRLEPAALVRLRVIEGFAIVDATVAGTPVTFVLDTGAQAHLVLPDAADRLRLRRLPGTVPMIGTGGARQVPLALLEGVQLGPVALDPAPAPIAALPALPDVAPPLAGLLGAPILDRFDLDLDLAAGSLALYQAAACGDVSPALALRQTTVALTITPDRQALLPVRLDGAPLVALLDTGARATLLTTEAAKRLGLSAPISANTAAGVDGARLPVGHLHVRTLAIGDDIRTDAPLSIAPLDLGPADMLLGLDLLRSRRAWISYATSRLVLALPPPRASAPGSSPPRPSDRPPR